MLKHNTFGSLVICYFEKTFYLKLAENGATSTARALNQDEVTSILNNPDFNFILLRASINSPFRFLLFYHIATDTKHIHVMILELQGEVNPTVSLVRTNAIPLSLRKFYTSELFQNMSAEQIEDKQFFKLDEIRDIAVVGSYIVMAVAHNRLVKDTVSDHFLKIYFIDPSFKIYVLRHMSLPLSKLSFPREMKMIVGLREEKIDSEMSS